MGAGAHDVGPEGSMSVRFGDPEDWQAFATRNAKFMERYAALEARLQELVYTKRSSSSEIDGVIFLMTRFAADDFMEILLLCGNAEGYAAEKLLRSMFERVWTLLYLQKYPGELSRYVDWGNLARSKVLAAMPQDWRDEAIEPEVAEQIGALRKEAKERLGFTECESCGAQNPLSWSTKNPVGSAKEFGLQALVPTSYYLPLDHAHPNIGGLLQRLKLADGEVEVLDRRDSARCDRVLVSAHTLLLRAVQACVGQLKLDETRYAHLADD
jgi:hypothetical protein